MPDESTSNQEMNAALRAAAGFQMPKPAPAEPEAATDDEIARLTALRDELAPAGGEALAAAERQVDAARIAAAVGRACADTGIPVAHVADVVKLITNRGALKFNQDGTPHAASVRAGVAELVRKYPGLADGPPPPAPRPVSFDGGVRGQVPEAGPDMNTQLRDAMNGKRARRLGS